MLGTKRKRLCHGIRENGKSRILTGLLLLALIILQFLPGQSVSAYADLRKSNKDTYVFETPEDLAELCSMQGYSASGAYQSFMGSSLQEIVEKDFIVENDLTLPAGVWIHIAGRLVIPEGVTLTVSETGSLGLFNLRLEGKLVNNGTIYQSVQPDEERGILIPVTEGQGSVLNEGRLTLRNPAEDFAENRIQGDGHTSIVLTRSSREFTEKYQFSDALRETEDNPNAEYELYLLDDTVLNGEIYLPKNLDLEISGKLTVPEDSLLISDAYVSIDSVLRIDGQIQNNAVMNISSSGEVLLADETCYTGGGSVYVESGRGFPFTGIEEERFEHDIRTNCYKLRERSAITSPDEESMTESTEQSSRQQWYRLQFIIREILYRLKMLMEDVPVLWLLLIFVILPKMLKAKSKSTAKRGPGKTGSRAAEASRTVPKPDRNAFMPEPDITDYDRQRRLRQLDGWLKDGLIDKEEYRVLKKRYKEEL